MATADDIQRLTIARFLAARPLTDALIEIDAAGVEPRLLSLTGQRDSLQRLEHDVQSEARAPSHFSALFQEPIPVIDLAGGTVAYSSRGGMLARMKSANADHGRERRMAQCPFSPAHQIDIADGMKAGAVFLIVASLDTPQYVHCQTLLLRHSAGRVLGVQYAWQTSKSVDPAA